MNTRPHHITDNTLIQLLRSVKSYDSDKALRYIIIDKQKRVTSKLRTPAHMKEGDIFNHALFELWKYVGKYIAGLPEPPDNPPPPFHDYEVYEIMRKLFDRLGAACMEILTYRFFDGMNHKEIAEKLNSTDGSTRARYSQCLSKLKKWINNDDNLARYIRNLLTE